MKKEQVEVGALVAIPTTKAGNDSSAIYYLNCLLQRWGYTYPYLVILEPYSVEDNVRLSMAPPFPQFCVESFSLKDLKLMPLN